MEDRIRKIVQLTRQCVEIMSDEEIVLLIDKRYGKNPLNEYKESKQSIFMKNEISRLQAEGEASDLQTAKKIARNNWKTCEFNPRCHYNKYMIEEGLNIKKQNADKNYEELKKLVYEGWLYSKINPHYEYNMKLKNEIETIQTEHPEYNKNEVLKQAKYNCKDMKKTVTHSPYNTFIQEEIDKIKQNNPDIKHKDAFKQATKNWNNLKNHI